MRFLAWCLAIELVVCSNDQIRTVRFDTSAWPALLALGEQADNFLTLTQSTDDGDNGQDSGDGDPADQEPGDADVDSADCSEKLLFEVEVTILGKLGPKDANPSDEEKKQLKDEASKWVFATLLRSMLKNSQDFKLSPTATPEILVQTQEPFKDNIDGQRSPLERTWFGYDFPDTDVCSARAFGRFLCRDYDSQDEELLTGFLRALDVAKQYPSLAMEMASKAGLGTKSIIILGASAVDRSDPSKEVRNSFCNWRKKFSSTSIQGAFMLPDCPSHAARCGDRPNLCKEEEKDHWKCKCTLGYEGDLKIPGLQETPSRGPFNYEGECKPISGYCPVNGKYPLKQLNGANAVGFLGETVTPQCPTGFEATGSSECAESQSHEGKWSPEPRCDFLPSTMPQKPFCLAPEHKGSLHLTKCNMCSAVEPGKKGPSCDCEVQCATDYEVLGEKKGGKKACIAKEQWLSLNGPFEGCDEEHGAKRVPLFVGGDSSGGGTTMSLVLTLAKRPQLLGQKLAGAFFFSPWTNLMCNTPEYYSNAFSKIQGSGKFQDDSKLTMYTGDILFQEVTPENADAFNGNAVDYLGGDFELQTDPIASPFFAQPADFAGSLPPLYFAVGASESILGDSVRVAQHAAQGGCDVILEVYHGMWHVFPMYSEGCGLGEPLWAGAYAINQTGLFVRHIHEQGRLPYKLKVEGPNGGPPESSILAKFWQPSVSKVPFFRYLYDPNVRHFSKVGELLPNRDATYSYKDIMKDLAKQSPWIVLPSLTGAAVTIFVMGFCLGARSTSGTARAPRPIYWGSRSWSLRRSSGA